MQYQGGNSLLSQNDQISNRTMLFQSLLGSFEAVPLDNNNMYSLIRSAKYKQMLQNLDKGEEIRGKLDQRCHALELQNRQLNREVQLYMQRMVQFKSNEEMLEKEMEKLNEAIRCREERLIYLEGRVKEMEVSKDVQQGVSFVVEGPKMGVLESTAVQTCYQQDHNSELNIQSEIPSFSSPESMQTKLYLLLRSNAERFQSQFKLRMKELQESQVKIQNWQNEKRQLVEENGRLKEMAKLKGEENEKIRIWQESINKFIGNINKEIGQKTSERGIVEEEKEGGEVREESWEEVAMKRGRLAEMRVRIREAEELMAVEEEEEVQEEGPVVTLVKLTQKVKTLVRNMLVEAQYLK